MALLRELIQARRALLHADKAVSRVIPKHVAEFVSDHKRAIGLAAIVAALGAGHLIGKYRAKKWIKAHHADTDATRDPSKELT